MKNSFIVKFATNLLVMNLGLTGFPAYVVSFLASIILSKFIDLGILVVDLSMDSLREALREEEWREAAEKAYEHAMARVYTEAEKEKIRLEYVATLKRYVFIGVPNGANP